MASQDYQKTRIAEFEKKIENMSAVLNTDKDFKCDARMVTAHYQQKIQKTNYESTNPIEVDRYIRSKNVTSAISSRHKKHDP